MKEKRPRLERERKTVGVMIKMYCREKHGTRQGLCPECEELWKYVQVRLDRCPFQEGKTTCKNCPVHCYRPDMKQRITEVMRFAGPKMWYRHPILTLWHFIDGARKVPLEFDGSSWVKWRGKLGKE